MTASQTAIAEQHGDRPANRHWTVQPKAKRAVSGADAQLGQCGTGMASEISGTEPGKASRSSRAVERDVVTVEGETGTLEAGRAPRRPGFPHLASAGGRTAYRRNGEAGSIPSGHSKGRHRSAGITGDQVRPERGATVCSFGGQQGTLRGKRTTAV